jgi:geranylgeranyl reductase
LSCPVLHTPQVTKMKMISPSNREVDVGKTLSETEYIGMCR